MRAAQRFALYLVIVAQVFLPAACSHDTTYHGAAEEGGLFGAFASSFDLGEKTFAIVRDQLSASANRPVEKVAALDARHDDFVSAVNAVITADAIALLGPTIKAFFDLIDDGTIPSMARNVADICDSVAGEPTQRTLQALVALKSTRGVLQADDLLDYLARSANYPEVEQVFGAIAELVRENDGVDDRGAPNGEANLVRDVQAFASRLLREASTAPSGSRAGAAGLLDGLSTELLADAPPRGGTPGAAGAPSWAVRVDKNQNPAVAKDGQGKLLAPFVDRNGDGAADVNADGQPVDAQGSAIAIAPFGAPYAQGRDADGLALAANGSDRLYQYFDAKQTLLSHFLQLGAEGLRRRIHEQACDVAEIALGARVRNDNGTPALASDDWSGFASDNPVPDLAWGLLEVAKYDQLPKLLRAASSIMKTDPALGERLFVTAGKIVEKLRPIALAPSSTPAAQARALTDQLVTLGDQVFRTPTTATTSVGRDLLDVLHTIGGSARSLPRELALMARYRKLVVDQSGNPTTGSQLVDWSQPATAAGSPQGENRSNVQQLLDLLAHADSCSTFVWVGKPLSETIINLMAGQSAGTASSLISFLNNPIVKSLASLSCSGISSDLDALNGLAASGALSGFLPIAKAFVDKGETRLLIDILKTVDASYSACVRPQESKLADVLDSGAFDPIFDTLDMLVAGRNGQAIVDPVSGARAIDLLADAVANLLAHPAGGLADRRGLKHATLFHIVADPLRRIDDEVAAVSGGPALHTALAYAVTDLVIERVTNAQGVEELANPSIVPFASHMLDLVARNLPTDAGQRQARLADVQASTVSFLLSHDFATAFDLARTVRFSPVAPTLYDAVENLLTPNPVAQDDIFGALLKLVVCALQTTVDTGALRDLAAFGADLFDPAQGRALNLVDGLAKLLVADKGKTCITLFRNALNAPPAGKGLAPGATPATVLISVLDDVRAAGSAGGGSSSASTDVADLKGLLESASAFIRDDTGGLGRLFDLIRNRPK